MANLLLAGYKPIFQSSNFYLSSLKRRYGEKSGGYLGTLDPFAKGMMILAFGQYSRLFPYFSKAKKTYCATLWLGLQSDSLDIENIIDIKQAKESTIEEIESIFSKLLGRHSYIPPKFSAKHINGKRAYELARAGISFELKKVEMEVFSLKLLGYSHPFIHFEVTLSGGGYVRSIGEMIAKRLGVFGGLSSLERIEECGILTDGYERKLDPLEVLNLPILHGEEIGGEAFKKRIENGQKICLKNQKNGFYVLDFEDFFSIIEAKENNIFYRLNRIYKC